MDFFGFNKKEKKILLFIVFISFGIRLFLMFYFKSYLMNNDWAFGYEAGRVAKAIATGEGFNSPFHTPTGPTGFLPPLYPYFLALIFKIFGVYSTSAAIIALGINCLVSALTCIPLYAISRRFFGCNTGYITASVFAVYPPSVWQAINTVWDTTIFTFLGLVIMYCLLLLPQRLNYRNSALFGLFLGFTILFKTVIVACYPFILIWLFLKNPLILKKRISYIAMICLMMFISLTPWLVRNYLVFGRLMLQTNFGLEFKLDNNPRIWHAFEETGDRLAFIQEHPTINPEEFRMYKQLGELRYMALCLDETKTFVKENPQKFFRLIAHRFYSFWIGNWGNKNEWKGNLRTSLSLSGLKNIFLALPLPFMIIGIALAIKKKIDISLPLIYLTFIPIVYYITHVSARYRYPIEPIILLLAIYGFCTMLQFFGYHREATLESRT